MRERTVAKTNSGAGDAFKKAIRTAAKTIGKAKHRTAARKIAKPKMEMTALNGHLNAQQLIAAQSQPKTRMTTTVSSGPQSTAEKHGQEVTIPQMTGDNKPDGDLNRKCSHDHS